MKILQLLRDDRKLCCHLCYVKNVGLLVDIVALLIQHLLGGLSELVELCR